MEKLSDLHRQIVFSMAENDMVTMKVYREFGFDSRKLKRNLDEITKQTGLDPRIFYDLCMLIDMLKEGSL